MWSMPVSLACKMNRPSTNAFLPFPFDPEREVLAALEDADDERLWRVVRELPDEDAVLQLVAEEAPRLSHRQRAGAWFSELLLVPVIERTVGQVIANRASWNEGEQCFSDAVRAWTVGLEEYTIFRGISPYEWVAAWEPSMPRQHLLAALPGSTPRFLTFKPGNLVLPDGSPRLGFVAVALRNRRRWPQLPTPDTLRDARFRQVAAQAFCRTAVQDVEVLPPDQVSAALADGLCLWLSVLHEVDQITGWDMTPSTAWKDAVKVSLVLGREGAAPVQFHLRKHQVAPVGVDCVAALLGALAPRAPVAAAH